jgi:hypothetical protein
MASRDFSKDQVAVDLSMANSQAAPTLAYLNSLPGAGRYNVNLAFQKDVKGAQDAQQKGTLDSWQPTNLQGCATGVCSDISKDTGGQVKVQKTGEAEGGKKKSWLQKLMDILMLLVALYSIYGMITGVVGHMSKSGKAKAETEEVIKSTPLVKPGVIKQVPMVQNEIIKTTPLVRPGLEAVPIRLDSPVISTALNNISIGQANVLNQQGYSISVGGSSYDVIKTASRK